MKFENIKTASVETETVRVTLSLSLSLSLSTLDCRQVVAPSMLTDPSQYSKHQMEKVESPVLMVTCSTQNFC